MRIAKCLLAPLTIALIASIGPNVAYATDPPGSVARKALPLIPVEVLDAKGQKVAGADVVFMMGVASTLPSPSWAVQRAVTDGEGKASAHVVLGPAEQIPPAATVWAYKPGFGMVLDYIVLKSAIARGESPPVTRLVLETAVPQTITVVDADDHPIEGLRLAPRACMRKVGSPAALPEAWLDSLSSTTDAKGQVTFRCFAGPFQAVAVRVAGPSMVTHTLPLVDGPRDATLKLGQTGRLVGFVRSESGEPLASVSVQVWIRGSGTRPRFNPGQTITNEERIVIEERSIKTGSQGAFQTPAVLLNGSTYCVVIRHPGFAPFYSDWVTLDGARAVAPPSRLRALKTLTGLVVDRQGRGVFGVRVFLPGGQTSTVSDAEGRFTLRGVVPERNFVMGQHPDFRFQGWGVDAAASTGELKLTLARKTEALDRRMTALEEPISLGDARTLASQLFEPYLQQVLENGTEIEKRAVIQSLAEIDLDRAVNLFHQGVSKDVRAPNLLRNILVGKLAAKDLAEAELMMEPVTEPRARIVALLQIVKVLPTGQVERKRQLVEKTIPLLSAITSDAVKLLSVGPIARAWLDLGDRDRARTLLHEYLPLQDKLQQKSRRASLMVVQLARLEPEAGFERIAKIPEEDRASYLEFAIPEIAIDQPALAERLWQLKGSQDEFRITTTLQLCRRFGRVDPDRGRRVAESRLARGERVGAWASLAVGLAERNDRPGALEAIDRAIAGIDEVIEKGPRLEEAIPFRGFEIREYNPAVFILPLVERAAPERLEEIFWRAVALHARVEPVQERVLSGFVNGGECTLLARYDRQVASVLFEPVDHYFESLVSRKPTVAAFDTALIVAKACIEPRGAVELLEAFPPAPERSRFSPQNAARIELARALTAPALERWRIRWKTAAPELPLDD